jgi:hypothetical protein
MDGVWASSDGVFVANFERGHFTSRFTATNEILAQGAYSVAGGGISMQWISAATKQQRAATCSFAGSDIVTCNQEGGGHFELRRSAANQTMPAPALSQRQHRFRAPGRYRRQADQGVTAEGVAD